MYELIFIKLFLVRENYLAYRSYLKTKELDKQIAAILGGLDVWYKTNESGNPELSDVYFLCVNKLDKGVLDALFKRLEAANPQQTALAALQSFKMQRMMEDISIASYEAAEGRKTAQDVLAMVEKLSVPIVEEKEPFVQETLGDLLKDQVKSRGLRWRLQTLNRMLGSLRGGDFGFFVARPETGKTTMLSSEATHWASQLTADQGPGIYFNNEEMGKKVKLKLYQSALGATLTVLLGNENKSEAEYQSLTKGKLLLYDSDVLWKSKIEATCARYKPSFIIFDQIDKIKGFEADREDLRMGAIYEWARSLAKRLDCPVIGVCQADGQAEGIQWLNMGHVSNAKTSKQAEADWIVGIGKLDDPAYSYVRYLSVMKNKLYGDTDTDPSLRHGRMEVIIHPEYGRYEDIVS